MLNMKYFIWASLAGAFIPIIGILNARVGRALGEPFYATVLVFLIALSIALSVSIAFGRMSPSIHNLSTLQLIDFGGGAIVAFYVVSATILAPKIGVANFILMAVSSQIVFSLLVDHFGFFGAPGKPVNVLQVVGAVILLAGLIITQLTSANSG